MSHGAIIVVRIARIIKETPEVKRFILVPTETDRLPPFAAGAHITTYAEFEGRVFERNYSLCGGGERNQYEIAVRRSDASEGGSAGWHDHMHVGDVLRISPPKNHFLLSQRARQHVFLAAGIGITPFLSMMAAAEAGSGSFELHYAARSRSHCAFYQVIQSRYPWSRFYFSEDGSRLSPRVLDDARVGTHVYMCGPGAFLDEFGSYAESLGFPKSNVHFERFTAPNQQKRPFSVSLRKSDFTLEVSAQDTLLSALIRAGIPVHSACRVGGCGTCEVGVVAGEVDHRDFYLTDAEKAANRSMMSCVSRAAGDSLVIDL